MYTVNEKDDRMRCCMIMEVYENGDLRVCTVQDRDALRLRI